MKTTNFVNRASLKSAFNADNNTFNRAFRFLNDLSRQASVKVPANPSADDKSKEATITRAEIKKATATNNNIADALKIMRAFGITGVCNDKALKEAKKLTDKFCINVCKQTVKKQDGTETTIFQGVKFAKLPTYLKDAKGVDYKNTFAVVRASWIEQIFEVAENLATLKENGANLEEYKPEEARKVYELTQAPHKEDTTPTGASAKVYTWQEAEGDLTNEKGEKIKTAEIFKIWYKEAIRNAEANAIGRTAKEDYLKNNK